MKLQGILFLGFISYASSCLDSKLLLEGKSYGYAETNGPSRWAEMFDTCNGTNQSPIALDACESVAFPPLLFSGHWEEQPAEMSVHNTGHSIEVRYPGVSPTLSGGPLTGEYTLEQLHFHWGADDVGSEHSVDGVFYGMEMHILHYKTEYGSFENAVNFTDGISVVTIMLEATDTVHQGLASLVEILPAVSSGPGVSTLAPVNLMTWLQPHLENPATYHTYYGSITGPPCQEAVTWIVLHGTDFVGRQQIAEFRTVTGNEGLITENRRPLQPLNGRTVSCNRS